MARKFAVLVLAVAIATPIAAFAQTTQDTHHGNAGDAVIIGPGHSPMVTDNNPKAPAGKLSNGHSETPSSPPPATGDTHH